MFGVSCILVFDFVSWYSPNVSLCKQNYFNISYVHRCYKSPGWEGGKLREALERNMKVT